MNNLTNTFIWIIFAALSVFLIGSMFAIPQLNYGGDIVEYHGITESVIKDFRIHLTQEAADNLVFYLQPAYLQDPGYYIEGRNGDRYPVHFIAYSILAVPVRVFLKVLSLNELHTLRLTNVIILLGVSFYTLKTFLSGFLNRLSFLFFVFLSPLLWFLIWPGPDVFYLSFLLLGIFYFMNKHYIPAILFTVLASWHSQPLIITAVGMGLFFLYRTVRIEKAPAKQHTHTDPVHHSQTHQEYSIHEQPEEHIEHPRHIKHETYLSVHGKSLLILIGIGLLALIPYLYNLYAFNTLTPWTILQDGWTRLNGFGIHNASPIKLLEQLFDLNFGLFWYAPLLFIIGVFVAIKESIRRKDILFLTLLMFPVTALFYQTNPAWHYGTSGFGPSRHAIFLLPLLIAYATYGLSTFRFKIPVLILFVITQLYIASLNGFMNPNLLNTLQHSPFATYVLKHAPYLYQPTPEIFVDRTNHTDITYPTSAIYKDGDACKKAYVLITEKDRLSVECGRIPDGYEEKFDNPFARKTNDSRQTYTIEATFWPDPGSCGDNFFPTEERPYVCMKTLEDVLRETGVNEPERFENVDKLPGVWKLKTGDPVSITIPPGYFIHHYSFDGVYVTY